MSCEGHLEDMRDEVALVPWPWVVVAVTPSQRERLEAKVRDWNKFNPDKLWTLSKERITGSQTPGDVERTLHACGHYQGSTLLALTPKSENLGNDAGELQRTQGQAMELAGFLLL